MAINAALRPLTGSLGADGVVGSLPALVSAFESYGSAELAGPIGLLRCTFETLQGQVGGIDASFEPLRGQFLGPDKLYGVLAPLTGSFVALSGRNATLAAALLPLRGQFVDRTLAAARLSAYFQPLRASFVSSQTLLDVALDGTFRALQGRFGSLTGAAAELEGELHHLVGAFASYQVGVNDELVLRLEPLRARFRSEPVIEASYRGWTMNPALVGEDRRGNSRSGVTEYENFEFNSFTRFAGGELAAGPEGVFRLGGKKDLLSDITPSIATGFIDFDSPFLKTAVEMFLALRTDGTVLITVWVDDDVSYEYVVPYYGRETLQQIRRKFGKGLKSRYFKFEVAGVDGAIFDLDALAVEPALMSRKEG